MKKLLLILVLFFPLTLFAYTSPGKPTGYVNDFAGILSTTEKASLESKSAFVDRTTGFQVAIVTVPSLGGDTVENFATKLFEEWGIGSAEKDTGLLILVSVEDRAVRIETGYGAEGPVTDLQAGNVIRNVITPAFKEGDYFLGLDGALSATIEIINKSPEAAKYSAENQDTMPKKSSDGFSIEGLFFIFIVFINIFAKILGKTKSWWLGGVIGAIMGAIVGFIWGFIPLGIGAITVLTILGLVFDFLVSKNGGKGGSGGNGFWIFPMGGGHGGSGGGGFGGFGGGMSGGGGASGRW